jgi:hypothetical protein
MHHMVLSSFCVKCVDLITLIETRGSMLIFFYSLMVVDTFTGGDGC